MAHRSSGSLSQLAVIIPTWAEDHTVRILSECPANPAHRNALDGLSVRRVCGQFLAVFHHLKQDV
ncbi:MAG TPA: hypothetical protein VKU00_28625, partial [Chthonomonadaceae bacterium]|nr:hypothetical protein [Chthonomonadaceae bacterium]